MNGAPGHPVTCRVAKPWPKVLTQIAPGDHVMVHGTVRGIATFVSVVIEPCSVILREPR